MFRWHREHCTGEVFGAVEGVPWEIGFFVSKCGFAGGKLYSRESSLTKEVSRSRGDLC